MCLLSVARSCTSRDDSENHQQVQAGCRCSTGAACRTMGLGQSAESHPHPLEKRCPLWSEDLCRFPMLLLRRNRTFNQEKKKTSPDFRHAALWCPLLAKPNVSVSKAEIFTGSSSSVTKPSLTGKELMRAGHLDLQLRGNELIRDPLVLSNWGYP